VVRVHLGTVEAGGYGNIASGFFMGPRNRDTVKWTRNGVAARKPGA
jgi:hypothetical protein